MTTALMQRSVSSMRRERRVTIKVKRVCVSEHNTRRSMRHERWRWAPTSRDFLRQVSAFLKVTFTYAEKHRCVRVCRADGWPWVPHVCSRWWALPRGNYIYPHRSQSKDMERDIACMCVLILQWITVCLQLLARKGLREIRVCLAWRI